MMDDDADVDDDGWRVKKTQTIRGKKKVQR